MSGQPSAEDLARQLAVLEERMNTHQAEYRTDIARLAEDMAKRDAEAAKRDAEAAKRETRMLLSVAAMIGLGIAILGFIL